MKALTIVNTMQALTKATNKYGMYISIQTYKIEIHDVIAEIMKAAPYLTKNDETHMSIMFDGYGVLLFDTREEMERYYDMTSGNDGPTKLNDYDGPCIVYAITCDNEGNIDNENT